MRTFLASLSIVLLLSGLSVADQSSSYGTTQGFYDWYLQSGSDYRKNFSQARPFFSDDLYDMLNTGLSNSPDDEFWIDFDPFIGAQMDAQKVSVGKPKTLGANLVMVTVTPYLNAGPGDKPEAAPDIKIYLKKIGPTWRIANIAYSGDYPFELKKFLKDGLGK